MHRNAACALRITYYVLFGVLIAGTGIYVAPHLYAAVSTYIYPPDRNILVSRFFEPDDFPVVSSGDAITVTIDVTNDEGVALRGFYYSDQVPNGWVVNTASVSVSGSPIADYTYGQGYTDEVYTGFTPHRWALEMPQGDGAFSPTHPIPAFGGTARIVYTMIVSGGTGSDYSIGHDAWAGWLQTAPTGTAVFGYQEITTTLNADFTAEPRSGVAPLTVQFTDLSTGGPTTWAWDFGDGSSVSSQKHPTHIYAIPGIYTVTLGITGPGGTDQVIRPAYITVTAPPPTADFTASPRSGVTPFTAAFTDLSAGDITAWLWDFGDGLTSTIQHPTHTYTIPGQFGVTLTVSGPVGPDTESKPNYITATTPPPTADFTAPSCSGMAPFTVAFTDLSAVDITTWTWNFGDGTTAQAQNPIHTYNIVGRFTVSLTVSNAAYSDTVAKPGFITVTAPSLQADFTARPQFGLPSLTVQLTDLSVGNVLTHVWDFGEGGMLLLPGPTHTYVYIYSDLGYYTVSLTVQDAYTSNILVRPQYIHVTDVIYNVYLPVVLKQSRTVTPIKIKTGMVHFRPPRSENSFTLLRFRGSPSFKISCRKPRNRCFGGQSGRFSSF